MSVVAILIAVVVPNFRGLIQNNRSQAQANELLSGLMLARSEALKRGLPVSICSSTDQISCADSTNWSSGWIVFTDNSGSPGIKDGTDEIIRVWEALKGSATLNAATLKNIQYLPNGEVVTADNFTLTVPDCKGEQARTISMNATGRAQVTTATCS